jgi:hypothetical protein
MMTSAQKQQVYKLRLQGLGYKAISQEIQISTDAVKSYCKRHHLNDLAQLNDQTNQNAGLCLQCHKPIFQKKCGRTKKFCSDACRYTWWNKNQDKRRKSAAAMYHYTCQHCGRKFSAYGDKHRKYCSGDCFIKAKFWREEDGTDGQIASS